MKNLQSIEITTSRYHVDTKKILSIFLRRGLTVCSKQKRHDLPNNLKDETSIAYSISLVYRIYLKMRHRVFESIFLLVLLFLPQCTQAALSAITINTIQGTKPYLLLPDGKTKVTSLEYLLGFSMPKRDGIEGIELIDSTMASKVIFAPAGMRYKDILALVDIDGQLHDIEALVGDDDGDAVLAENTLVKGQIKATWYDAGKVINQEDLGNTLSACGGPYTLTIEIPAAVSVHTAFGDPDNNSYGNHSGVTYTFKQADMRICYLRPLDMTTYPAKNGLGGGYDSDVFDPDKGFLATNKEFPGTALKGVGFYVLGSGADQSKYRCSISSGITETLKLSTVPGISGQNCYVEYTSTRPTSDTTIELAYEVESGKYQTVDSYTLKRPNKWMRYQSPKPYVNGSVDPNIQAVYPAANICAGNIETEKMTYAESLTYFYSFQDMTNIPLQSDGSVTISGEAKFTRALDKTFLGVWGNIYAGYPNNDFYNKTYKHSSGIIYNTDTMWVGSARKGINPIQAQYVFSIVDGLTGWQERPNIFACKETIY